MIPNTGSYRLTNARLHASLTPGFGAAFDRDGFALADIAVADGKISSITAHGRSKAPADAIDLAGRIVLPCFIDCHTHIDKGHIWPRKPNPNGTFMGALNAAGADRAARWSAEDVARRMDFSLRSAYAHGTRALRTHLDSVAPQEEISWPVFETTRETWRGRIELQAACLLGIERGYPGDVCAAARIGDFEALSRSAGDPVAVDIGEFAMEPAIDEPAERFMTRMADEMR